jgi:putative membrane protein
MGRSSFYNERHMSQLDELFSDSAQERIREAVDQAEGRTGGEIVSYVVGSSDTYAAAHWVSALLGGMLAPVLTLFAYERLEIWGLPPAIWMLTPVLAGAVIGYLAAATVPVWRRSLIGERTLDRRTRRRAAVAFLEEEVFKTRDRTGVLIFLSLFEHRVVIMGDEGINRAVEPADWQRIVDGIVAGIREQRPADALVSAIRECGELLEEKSVAIRPDDTNELSDELRRRDS